MITTPGPGGPAPGDATADILPGGVVVRMMRADDWRERRALRLEMLADTPLAFTETLAEAHGRTEAEWRAQGERAVSGGGCTVVAVSGGRLVGTMGCFVGRDARAYLVTVYVSPPFRGRARGVADALLARVERWLIEETTAERLVLSVHEDNRRAQSFYRRRGFTPTGESSPYPLDPTRRDLEFGRPVGAYSSASPAVPSDPPA